jgi:hypothetical protein
MTLPLGFVCDTCNQYFGSKVEADVLRSPPFSIERPGAGLRTKKGKWSRFDGDGYSLMASGYRDQLLICSQPGRTEAFDLLNQHGPIVISPPPGNWDLFARFFLKMGLELLVGGGAVDPFASAFDAARDCARTGRGVRNWDVASGISPDRGALYISSREDEFGQLDTHQLYQYEIGVMHNGDAVLNFIFGTHVFACNLTQPSLAEYLIGFNAMNSFQLRSRF